MTNEKNTTGSNKQFTARNSSSLEALAPDEKLPEITFRAIVIAMVITIFLAAANAYLGLKVGLTISASIPAAVMAMGILRFFKNSNILESNIIQTAASSGEALAAGIAYTLPALIMIHYWTTFDYWHTVCIAFLGGLLGVLFSILLRRVLLDDELLRFPEGTAIGNILKASGHQFTGLGELLGGGLIGGVISFCQSGLKLFSSGIEVWFPAAGTVFGMGLGFDVALIGAGYIIGFNVCMVFLVGVLLGWGIGVPVTVSLFGYQKGISYVDVAFTAWSNHIRYVGLGTMLIGGLWSVICFVKPMLQGAAKSIRFMRQSHLNNLVVPRVERDIPKHYVVLAIVCLLIPTYLLIDQYTHGSVLNALTGPLTGTNCLGLALIILIGFMFSAICGYFAGLVGASASSVSSLALLALIIVSLLLVFLFSPYLNVATLSDNKSIALAAVAIIITAIIASSAAISVDTMQDLKTGQMVGATPWKQQVMLFLGVTVSSLVIPFILQILLSAYGLTNMSSTHVDTSQMLSAPQASLMAATVQAIFTHSLNWPMMTVGMIIAVLILLVEQMLKPYGIRVPILAIGIGIYLPLTTATSLVLGGIVVFIAERLIKRRDQRLASTEMLSQNRSQRGLLLACGLVAGSAIMGVLLAIPFAIAGSTDLLRLIPITPFVSGVLGSVAILLLCAGIIFYILREPKT